jgi:hypothetical protein
MTEQEWLSSSDPVTMLQFLRGQASERKLRLFACACCRRIWDLLTDERSRRAVEVAERFADGEATEDERAAAYAAAVVARPSHPADLHLGSTAAVMAVYRGLTDAGFDGRGALRSQARDIVFVAWQAAGVAANARMLAGEHSAIFLSADGDIVGVMLPRENLAANTARTNSVFMGECVAQARLLREFLGNPLRSVFLDASWRAWNSSTIPGLARAIYDERRFKDLPILADALEEAGCTDAAVLDHCRQPGEHARGCWVLDLLLGKA